MIRRLWFLLTLSFLAIAFPAQSQQPVAGQTVLRTQTHLVVVDVVVQGKQQTPVHGLKLSDFQIMEDGVAQHVRSFEEHTSALVRPFTRPPGPKLPPGMYTNYTTVDPDRAVNVLLVDALNTPEISQSWLHAQLVSFIKAEPRGASTAILGLSGGLYMIQGFTSDPDVLLHAIEHKTSPQKGPMLDDSLRGQGDDTMDELVAEHSAVDSLTSAALQKMLTNLQAFERSLEVQRTQSRAGITLNALNAIARYLAAIPGRKNLIWFSGAFPVNPIPLVNQSAMPYGSALLPGSVDTNSGFSNLAGTEDEFRETTNLLARSQVAVYPVDARGIQNFGGLDATTEGTAYARNPQVLPGGSGSAAYAGGKIDDFFTEQSAEHGVMAAMAQETGGKAFYNTNAIGQAAVGAIENGSNYYTLSYTPTNTHWDGKFRKIGVTVEGQHYSLAYRRGYYADDTENRSAKPAASAFAGPTDPITAGMSHGAPDATQILISVRSNLPADKPDMLLSREDHVDDQHAMKSLGPYRHATLTCVADARALQTEVLPNGHYAFNAEMLVYEFDAEGRLLNHAVKGITADMTPDNYAHLLRNGLALNQQISVPVRGETFIRVGLHDLASNGIGSLELSSRSLANLGTPNDTPKSESKLTQSATP